MRLKIRTIFEATNFKITGGLFILLYIFTWIRIVPEVQELIVRMDKRCIGEAFEDRTVYPKGVSLLSPYISQIRDVSYKFGNSKPRKYTNNIKTVVIPVGPFISYYFYHLESAGFECGGYGFTYIGLNNELKKTRVSTHWIM